MAYCEKCGAYIPDGQTKCLACGYDSAAQEQYTSGAQTAPAEDSWAAQERLREERERQEAERRRRQEEYRRQAQEEYARRRAEQARQETWEEAPQGHPYSREGQVNRRRANRRTNNKIPAALSYLGILFILPYILCPDDQFARFHAKQGLVLFLFNAVAAVVKAFTGLGWLLELFNLYCIFKGMSAALGGRVEELPLIGQFARRFR